MAIFYCDLYNGNDSNNGLTTSTPKKTISAVSNLITAFGDEVKVRGYDNLSTNVGDMWWINGSLTLSGSTDLTSVLSGTTYIYKSTDTLPDIYKISSLSWNSGTSVMTVTLTIANGYYEGTTENCGVMKINLPGTVVAAQTFAKDGYYSGVGGSYSDCNARTGTTISGGWNEDYTSRTGYTLVYNTVGNPLITGRAFWDLSYFMTVGATRGFMTLRIGNSHHLINGGSTYGVYSGGYALLENCAFNVGYTNEPALNAGILEVRNCLIRGGNYSINGDNFGEGTYRPIVFKNNIMTNATNLGNAISYSIFINNILKVQNSWFLLRCKNSYFSGNTFYTVSTSPLFYACTDLYVINNNLSTNSSTYIEFSSGTFINSKITKSVDTAIGSDLILYDDTINTSYDIYSTSKLYDTSNAVSFVGNLLLYNNNYFHKISSTYLLFPDSSKNTILNNYASMTTTGITHSGNTSLKITQYGSTYDAYMGTVEFFVQTGISYTYSFYIKSSNNQNVYYNFYKNEVPMYSTWLSGTTSSSTWTEFTGSLSTISIPGVIKLYIKFNSGKGHYIYVSNIRLT